MKLTRNGFSLVEVLVSVLVLAIGVISMAHLQLASLRTARQTAVHTAALQLASEMAERLRAYAGRISAGQEVLLHDFSYLAAQDSIAADSPDCYLSHCSTHELVSFELRDWRARIAAMLPDGRVRICRDASPWDGNTGRFRWDCTAAPDGYAPIVIKIGWPVGRAAGQPESPQIVLTAGPSDK